MDWYQFATADPDSQFVAMNSYGSAPVKFGADKASRIADDKLWTKCEVLKQAFISKALKGGAGVDKSDFKDNDPAAPQITKYIQKGIEDGYQFTAIGNKSTDQKIVLSMEYKSLTGLTIISDDPAAEKEKWEIDAGPNETKIVVLECGFDQVGMSGGSGVMITKV